MKETFEDKWKRVDEKTQKRIKNDPSLLILQNRANALIKRIQQINDAITRRSNQIFLEELKKEFWQEQK